MVYRCANGHKIFTRQPNRWCPRCEEDYILTDDDPDELERLGFTEDCEENQWLFFDYPLRRAAWETPEFRKQMTADTIPFRPIRNSEDPQGNS